DADGLEANSNSKGSAFAASFFIFCLPFPAFNFPSCQISSTPVVAGEGFFSPGSVVAQARREFSALSLDCFVGASKNALNLRTKFL
ncbi:hypothetical protein, partial [Herbaspirillum sp. NPDC087042]|uniref:hypothetical protein n=1 Tax=Herbaspirillum sp. NPDC087042 TaxID=3364004 RepID=UPI00380575AE